MRVYECNLSCSAPCSELVNMWKVLAGDEAILKRVFSHLLGVLNLSLPYHEKMKGSKVTRSQTDMPQTVSTHQPLNSWAEAFSNRN